MPREAQGRFTVPTHIYLTATERAKLEQLTREHECDLSDLLSEIIAAYLTDVPEPVSQHPSQSRPSDELRRRLNEARRLQANRSQAHTPSWFDNYIAQLESELKRLEREHGGR